jgi:pimeloyl-ACP methyl ester carboxylesterase
LLLISGLTVLLWLFVSWLAADQMTRRVSALRPEPLPSVPWGTPQEIRLTTADGEELGAWFFPGRADQVAVVLLHGNGGTRSACLDQAEWLVAAKHPVLMVTLRAHGDSTGARNDFGLSARHDVVAAVEWLERNNCPHPVLWGRSLGAAAALFAAGELRDRVGGYVLECPYQNLRTAVRNRTRAKLPPLVDWVAYSGLSLMAPLVLENVDLISPVDAASNIPADTPVLILAGGMDWRAIPAEAAAIARRIGPRAEVVVFDKAGHLDLHRVDPSRYRELGLRFLGICNRSAR